MSAIKLFFIFHPYQKYYLLLKRPSPNKEDRIVDSVYLQYIALDLKIQQRLFSKLPKGFHFAFPLVRIYPRGMPMRPP